VDGRPLHARLQVVVLKTIHERLAIAATATPPMPCRLLKLAEARW
jgi:hypothetical protein